MDNLFSNLPPLLNELGMTLGISLLLGLGLREYYLSRPPVMRVGTTRTILLAATVGFALWVIAPAGAPYAVGLLILGGWLGLFYQRKLAREGSGLLGMFFILLSYALGPLAQETPAWFVVAIGISALFVLNAREKLVYLTEHMASQEVITLSKFLILSAVILPLTPREPLAAALPVSLHETWLAVVVISGISYLSYLAQAYFLKGRGILLTGAIGGLYSSTATTLVIARQSTKAKVRGDAYVAAILMATGMMYLRLLILVSIFDREIGWILCLPFTALGALTVLVAVRVGRRSQLPRAGDSVPGVSPNPLEIEAAAFFAGTFLLITGLTHYLLERFPTHGLQDMALVTGLTDIDPFVMAVVSGHLPQDKGILAAAIAMAAASNGLMKGLYVVLLAAPSVRRLGAGFLWASAGVTLALACYLPGWVSV